MTREEAIAIIRKEYLCVDRDCDIERSCGKCDLMIPSKKPILEAYKVAIEALEQEPKTGHWIECEDEVKCFCSECKEISDYPTKFCPNCGVRMIEPQESEKIETWNGIHAQITAPKGTFERIFNDADDDNDI